MNWTEEMIDCLKQEYASRKSMSQIADTLSERFGTSISTNAVVGKVHRLGLAVGGTEERRRKADCMGIVRNSNEDRWVFMGLMRRASARPADPIKPRSPDQLLPGERASILRRSPRRDALLPLDGPTGMVDAILSLRFDTCRWPMETPTGEFAFCQRKVEHGAYCAAHGAMAYVPVKKRRSDRAPVVNEGRW